MARVTLVVNNFDEGSETFLHSLAGQLVEIGHEVTVHVLLDGRTAMATGQSFDESSIRRSPGLPPARSRGFPLALVRLVFQDSWAVVEASRRARRAIGLSARGARAAAVAASLLATRPDVIHVAFSGIGVAIDDALRLLDADVRIVVSCRGSGELVAPGMDPTLGPRLGDLLRRVDVVHVVSDAVGDAVRAFGVPDASIRRVRPAVDTAAFPRARRRNRSGSLEVVTVARLHWIKGLELQIAALTELTGEGVDVVWTVVGDGPDRRELESRAELAGLRERMTFVGALAPDRLREVVADSDVLVCSSWSEGTSNSVLEAMAMGVPVVSSAAGGMPEVLTNGVDSLVFPVGDANSLASALRLVSQDSQLADSLADGGRRTVLRRFTVERQMEEWEALYEEVLSTPGRRR